MMVIIIQLWLIDPRTKETNKNEAGNVAECVIVTQAMGLFCRNKQGHVRGTMRAVAKWVSHKQNAKGIDREGEYLGDIQDGESTARKEGGGEPVLSKDVRSSLEGMGTKLRSSGNVGTEGLLECVGGGGEMSVVNEMWAALKSSTLTCNANGRDRFSKEPGDEEHAFWRRRKTSFGWRHWSMSERENKRGHVHVPVAGE
ncbi:hypothetical protein BJ165DRAFT_1405308 [Panaeolus papilionaceus]|nr:hypothetical protein BJ165DRAFT_1405308 [Panaeolus papilionaceus]